MSVEKIPKILYISDEIPQSIHAGSIQFYRIFKNHPADKLIVFGPKPSNGASILPAKYYEMRFPLQERLRLTRFTSLLSDLQSINILLTKLPKNLQKIADEFQPDIVVTLMQHITYYHPAYHYAKKRKIPFFIFCHDDTEEFSRIHPSFKKHLLKLNSKIYASAEKRICVSPEMAEAWEKKYGVKGDHFYPIASEKLTARPIDWSEELRNKKQVTLGYAGSLAYGYREGINEIIPVLESSNTLLKIFQNKDDGLQTSANIKFEGFAKTSEETWERIKNECDAVILPYSSDKAFENLYSTHFPSKLPEYTSLGMPVIINGPEYANGVRWAKRNSQFVQATNTDELSQALSKIKNDAALRKKLASVSLSVKEFKEQESIF